MQKDPGHPRERLDEPVRREELGSGMNDPVEMLATMVKGACLVGVFVLLFVSACLALQVFFQIGKLVTDPAATQSAVSGMAQLISGDQLVVRWSNDNHLEFGNLVAVVLLLFCYLLWLYVPVTLIWVCSRILLGLKRGPPNSRGKGR